MDWEIFAARWAPKAARSALLAVGMAVGLVTALPASAVTAGQPAPDFALPGLARDVQLSGSTGKVVYLDFWASWCTPCRQSFPWMNEIQARYRSNGLQIVGINLDKKRADADTFLARLPAGFDVVFDPAGQTPRAYDVKAMPTSVLIGKDGKVLWVHRGFAPEQRDELELKIRQALGLQKP